MTSVAGEPGRPDAPTARCGRGPRPRATMAAVGRVEPDDRGSAGRVVVSHASRGLGASSSGDGASAPSVASTSIVATPSAGDPRAPGARRHRVDLVGRARWSRGHPRTRARGSTWVSPAPRSRAPDDRPPGPAGRDGRAGPRHRSRERPTSGSPIHARHDVAPSVDRGHPGVLGRRSGHGSDPGDGSSGRCPRSTHEASPSRSRASCGVACQDGRGRRSAATRRTAGPRWLDAGRAEGLPHRAASRSARGHQSASSRTADAGIVTSRCAATIVGSVVSRMASTSSRKVIGRGAGAVGPERDVRQESHHEVVGRCPGGHQRRHREPVLPVAGPQVVGVVVHGRAVGDQDLRLGRELELLADLRHEHPQLGLARGATR